jgi:predicted DNA binding CopG/RHH family protein
MSKKTTKKKSNKTIASEEAAIDQWLDITDQSDSIAAGDVVKGRKGRPPVGSKISITLPDDLIIELKIAADKRAIGYQTLIRMIVKENIKKYG